MQRPTSELILSVGVRYDAAILVSRSRSQTTSKDGFQVELIPTTGSTNTEMAHLSSTYQESVCAVIIIVNLIGLYDKVGSVSVKIT